MRCIVLRHLQSFEIAWIAARSKSREGAPAALCSSGDPETKARRCKTSPADQKVFGHRLGT